MHNNQRV